MNRPLAIFLFILGSSSSLKPALASEIWLEKTITDFANSSFWETVCECLLETSVNVIGNCPSYHRAPSPSFDPSKLSGNDSLLYIGGKVLEIFYLNDYRNVPSPTSSKNQVEFLPLIAQTPVPMVFTRTGLTYEDVAPVFRDVPEGLISFQAKEENGEWNFIHAFGPTITQNEKGKDLFLSLIKKASQCRTKIDAVLVTKSKSSTYINPAWHTDGPGGGRGLVSFSSHPLDLSTRFSTLHPDLRKKPGSAAPKEWIDSLENTLVEGFGEGDLVLADTSEIYHRGVNASEIGSHERILIVIDFSKSAKGKVPGLGICDPDVTF